MHSTTPFRGVCGARVREDDEGHTWPSAQARARNQAPRQTLARYPGTCCETGRRYPPGTVLRRSGMGWAIA